MFHVYISQSFKVGFIDMETRRQGETNRANVTDEQ